MPNMRKPGGKGKSVNAGRGVTIRTGQRSFASANKRKRPTDPDDLPLDPDTVYDGDVGEDEGSPEFTAPTVEPFEDDLVSRRLKNLTVIPRAGGEDAALLHDFLYLFAKTETFIGTISSKTSFMKKAGGRLL